MTTKTDDDQIIAPQIALQEILPPSHTPDGKFAKGNSLSSLRTNTGKGFAKISSRVEKILDTKALADIEYAMQPGQRESMLGIDAVAYRRARAAIYGGNESQDVVDRIDGPVEQKARLNVNSRSVATTFTVQASVDFIREIVGGSPLPTPEEPVQD